MATIQGVYVALFGRPADPAGLAYFNGITNNGQDLAAIANLSGTAEYQDRFVGQNNAQIVTSIYQSLFNRDPEAAGLNFFVNALNTGALSINNIAIAILDGAQGQDKVISDNKIAAANLFTAAIDTPLEIAAYSGDDAAQAGRDFLTGVTTTPATQADAEAALKAYVDSTNIGNTVDLGTVANVVVGDVGGTNVSSNRNDTINTAAAGDWTAANQIDGGFGTDTLNATVDADVIVADGAGGTGFLRNVEILNITAETNPVLVDLENAVGVTQAWNVASSENLEITGLTLGTAIGLRGNLNGTVATFAFLEDTGTADTATLVVDAATNAGGAVVIGGIETLNVSIDGDSDLGTLVAADADTINLAGEGNLTLSVNSSATSIVNTVDGIVTIDLSLANNLETYTGSSNIDVITLNIADLTADVTINAGAGADTITLNGGVAADTVSVTLNGGAGSDLFYLGTGVALGNVVAASLTETLVTIGDFNKLEDSITFNGGTRAVLTVGELGQVSGQATLEAAINKAIEFFDGGEDTVIFSFGSDAYIYTDTTGNGLSNGDSLVKVAGISAADLDASNFTLV